jgi:hypothetical protein
MTDDKKWYVLDFNDGARVTAGGGAVEVMSFLGPLSTRDGEVRFSLRLWRASEHPDLMPESDRNTSRETCVLAVGSADALAVELRTADARYQIGHHDTGNSPARTIRYNLGNEVTVHESEVFAASEAGGLFLSYFRSGTISTDEYRLRELSRPGISPSPTHALTINFDEYRPVLPTVEAGEFSTFLSDTNDDEPSVLVLWPIPSGRTMADLTNEELSTHEEFMQTAGSSGRYTVEIRHQARLYTLGHKVDYLIWGTEPTEITVGSDVLPVYPHEIFTPSEVGDLFHHYRETGQIPEGRYLRRELQ